MEKTIKGRDIIIYLALKYEGDWNKIYEAIKSKELVHHDEVAEAVSSIKSKVSVIIDDDYPEALKKAYKPPFAIFYYGNITKLRHKKQITMLSEDNPTPSTGKKMEYFAESLSKKYGIITIQNKTTNEKVITQAAKNNNLTILGFEGIEAMKDKLHQLKDPLIMSEYPGSLEPKESNLPWAVRIASSLGDKLFVSEPQDRSYLGIAIGYSLYLDKQVLSISKKKTKKKENDENIVTVATIKDIEAIMGSAQLN
jgi:DNA processing protein